MSHMNSAHANVPPASRPASLAELCALSVAPDTASGPSALSAEPFLLVDANAARLRLEARLTLESWLCQLPCPVIAVAPDRGADPLASACDVAVPDLGSATALLSAIRAAPIAAAVLVQLLRVTGKLPLAEALTAESFAYSTLQAGPEFRRWLASHHAQPRPRADDGEAVLMEREGDRLALTLNRPSNHNAMTVEMRDALMESLQLVLADDSVAAVSIQARGKCFSTGGDLDEFGTAPDPATAHIVRSLALPGRLLAACAERARVRVHGACIGSGIEFPAFAGHITAAADAWFQLPELKFGLIPGAGGCSSIVRRIGRQRTAWLALTAKRIDARQAHAWGLVDAIE